MADTNETLVYSAAVRGFHVYQDVWKPLENEELECLFERHNLFDMFAIKTCHLKFFLVKFWRGLIFGNYQIHNFSQGFNFANCTFRNNSRGRNFANFGQSRENREI